MPSVDFKELKAAVAIDKVATTMLGLTLRPERNQFRTACPICNSTNPRSMVITPDKGAWFCFNGCGGGSAIDLVAKMRNCDIRAAALSIQEQFTVRTSTTVHSSTGAPGSRAAPGSGDGVRRVQGFDPEAYASRLDPGHDNLKDLGITAETLKDWKAGYASHGVMRGRLALPLAQGGKIVGYMGLALGDVQPRLLFPNGMQPADFIFGAEKTEPGELYLLREPLAVLKARENGVNAVCLLTETIAPVQLEMLSALMTERQCDALEFA